jgi:hypothetical protein
MPLSFKCGIDWPNLQRVDSLRTRQLRNKDWLPRKPCLQPELHGVVLAVD